MRQRVMIAMALSCEPKLLIADEPTTALDVTIQAQILELLKAIQERTGSALMLITHDLGVVAEMVDNVDRDVRRPGRGAGDRRAGAHRAHGRPTRWACIESIPTVEKRGGRLSAIKGVVPSPFNLPPGLPVRAALPVRLGALHAGAAGAVPSGERRQLARATSHLGRGEPAAGRHRGHRPAR